MNKILQDLINIEEVASFIDNVIVGMEEEKEHNKIVEEVVNRLAEDDLYVKPEKCKWKIREAEFLGVVIELERIKMEEENVKSILKWLTLKEFKDVWKFLGLADYYQQFIKDFTAIARLLYDLIKKDQKQDWTERQEKAFQELNEKFTKEPVLAVPDLDKKIRMEVDTLDYATEELSMKCKDGKWILVAFFLKSLNETERNYEIHNEKMLAVIRRLENWRHLLECTKFKFKVWTNHKNLEYFIKVQKLNRR